MSHYTKGVWLATKSKHGIDGGDHVIAVVDADADDRSILIHAPSDGGSPFEDARRIVACVNACQGMKTLHLEGAAIMLNSQHIEARESAGEYTELLLKQRDELLAALKLVMQTGTPVANVAYNLGQRDDQWDSSIYPSIRKFDEARLAAGSAIAKCEVHS